MGAIDNSTGQSGEVRSEMERMAQPDHATFLLGHAKQSAADGYSMLARDVKFRREVAEKIGTGFTVPTPMIPMVPRKEVKIETKVQA
jgi:hypothetical protein